MERSQTILIVDDDNAGRAMLSLCLRQEGYKVVAAASGEDALRELKRAPCDILITDAKMEAMNGFELSKRAKKVNPGICIMMISAASAEHDIKGYPIDKFFAKPLDVDKIVEWIETAAA